jgi:hypothetical protein
VDSTAHRKMCATHKRVRTIAMAVNGIALASQARTTNVTVQQKIIARNEIRIHVGQVPTCRRSNILMIVNIVPSLSYVL